jgi:hypothetical protein
VVAAPEDTVAVAVAVDPSLVDDVEAEGPLTFVGNEGLSITTLTFLRGGGRGGLLTGPAGGDATVDAVSRRRF